MSEKKKDKMVNGEIKMIRDLRQRIYGDIDAGPDYPFSEHNCIFCGAKNDLLRYKNSYVCEDCLEDIKN